MNATHYRIWTKKNRVNGRDYYQVAVSLFGPANDRLIGRRHSGLCWMGSTPGDGFADSLEQAIADGTPRGLLPISDDQWLAMDESDRYAAAPRWR